jgi:beta-phosphoglucomutase-like phosphatase (HAD superfamily)
MLRFPKAFVFSFEHVLVDLNNVCFSALNTALARAGAKQLTLSDYFTQYFELGPFEQIEKLSIFDPVANANKKRIFSDYTDHCFGLYLSELKPDLVRNQILTYLEKNQLKVGITSDLPSKCVFDSLTRLDWIYLVDTFTFHPLCSPKPDPSCYYRITQDLGVSLSDIVIIEGTEAGQLAANKVKTNLSVRIKNYDVLNLNYLLDLVKTE